MSGKEPKRRVSASSRSEYKFCRRAWDWGYREKLRPISEPKSAAWLGIGVHEVLAQFYDGKRCGITLTPEEMGERFEKWITEDIPNEDWQNLYPEEQERIEGFVEMGHALLAGYPKFAAENDAFEIIAVEETIIVKIPGTANYLKCIIDLLVRWKGKLWVLDHKTKASFEDPVVLELDDQMTTYLWAVWQKYGEMPGGAIYSQLRKKIPKVPETLKSGALSKAKGIDTTYDKFLEAIEANGLSVSDYTEVLERCKLNEFYKREPIARSEQALNRFGERLVMESREMMNKKVPIYPSEQRDCTWRCSYMMLCRCENDGGDTEAMIEANYVREEVR